MQDSTLEIDVQQTTHALRPRKGSNLNRFMSKGIYLLMWIFVVIICTSMSCKTVKSPEASNTDQSKRNATVVDYTGLDGCGKMLMLDDGRLILPINSNKLISDMHYGQRVAITFEAQESMASICMAEHLTAEIQSIEPIEEVDFSWLDKLTKKADPYSIYRCSDDDNTFIYVQTAKMSTAYSLEGQEICSTPGKAMSDCVRKFNDSQKCRIKGMP